MVGETGKAFEGYETKLMRAETALLDEQAKVIHLANDKLLSTFNEYSKFLLGTKKSHRNQHLVFAQIEDLSRPLAEAWRAWSSLLLIFDRFMETRVESVLRVLKPIFAELLRRRGEEIVKQ